MVYLDYNASTPIDERVLERMVEVYRTTYGNADSRTHLFGTKAKELVNSSRNTIAEVLDVSPMDLIFTSGSTESNNMAILGLMNYVKETGRNHFITTAIEHKSVLECMRYLERNGCTVDYVKPDQSGRVNVDEVLSHVSSHTALVSIMHVNSETGIIQPVQEIGQALKGTNTLFHVDATQGVGKLNDMLRALPYDMMSFTAHKIGGPQGIGGLVLRRNERYQRPPIQPLMYGGSQERGFRPGTTPVALVAGFAYAVQLCDLEENVNREACSEIKRQLLESISTVKYEINGSPEYCLPSMINVSFTGVDAEGLFLSLKDDYAFSNGSACNSNSHSPSYVLTAMGIPEERINEAVRLSWDKKTKVDFRKLVSYIKSIA